MSMTIQSSVKDKILAIPSETSKYEYEIRYHPGKANVVINVLRRKERVKPRRVREMAMSIQYRVRGMILAAQSEAFKQENIRAERLHGKEWNSGDDQLRFRWMIYLVVLADAAESVSDAIRFEYYLASSNGWTKSLILWAEIGESSLTGPELVLDMTDKVVLIKEKLKSARNRQKSYEDKRRKPLEFEVGDRVLLKVSLWKGVSLELGFVFLSMTISGAVSTSLLPPKELHFKEIKTIKSSIDDPPELELKDLLSHLEYAFLEGTDELPVIISKT
ncbi:hypothetical protein Tco_0500173 [Tanacetum coccineum]